ncbi:MAG: hypothetical protein HY903_11365 [Deltaproteobacteria bacterium]|nr:hypothetical protein [Deltaproteobacteria bacterium]
MANIVGEQAFSTDHGQLSVAEASRIDGAFYATVHGVPAEGITVQKGSSTPNAYFPLLDVHEARASNSLLVVEIREDLMKALDQGEGGAVEVKGFIDHRIEGEVRAWLEDTTRIAPGSIRVLHTNVTKDKAQSFFWIVVSGSVVGAVIVGIRRLRQTKVTPS